MTRRIILLMLAVLALGLGVAACGGDDDEDAEEPAAGDTMTEGGDGGGMHVMLAADPSGALAFDNATLKADAGEITIDFTNDASIPHNVAIEGNGVNEVSDTVTGGETSLTVTLEPGEYTFYCAVPGHRAGGMEGTLTVQ